MAKKFNLKNYISIDPSNALSYGSDNNLHIKTTTVTDNINGTVTINAGTGQVQDTIRPINELTAFSGEVDNALDYLPIFDASSNAILKINKNTLVHSQVLYNNGALTGAVPAEKELGIDTSTGTFYFKNGSGNWQQQPVGTTVNLLDNTDGTVTINAGLGGTQTTIRPINELTSATPVANTQIATATGTQHNKTAIFETINMPNTAQMPNSTALTHVIVSSDGNFSASPIAPIGQFMGQKLIFRQLATFTANLQVTNTNLAAPLAMRTGSVFTGVWDGSKWIQENNGATASNFDFFRSGAGATTLPNGTTDLTDDIYHNGRLAVGATASNQTPKTALSVVNSGTSTVTPVAGGGAIISDTTSARIYLEHQSAATNAKTSIIYSEGGSTKFSSVNDSGAGFIQTNLLVLNHTTGNVGIGVGNPTSRLHTIGSEARQITTITAATTLGEHRYIIAAGATTYAITLPAASSCIGRIYTIKTIQITKSISSFLNINNTATKVLRLHSVTNLISDGTNWQQI